MTPRRFTIDEWMAETGLAPPPGVGAASPPRKGNPSERLEIVPPASAPRARTGMSIVVVSVDDPEFVERTETWVWCSDYEPADVGYASVTRTPRRSAQVDGTRWSLVGRVETWLFFLSDDDHQTRS